MNDYYCLEENVFHIFIITIFATAKLFTHIIFN
jgi:hypothetical protein